MKTLLKASIVMLLFSTNLKAQTAAKAVYVEIGGPGLASINYDMRFQKKEDGLGFRVGLGGFVLLGESAVTVPFGLTYLLGKDERNYFELGAGVTLVSYKGILNESSGNFNSTFGHFYFGYRMQPKKGGFLFRAGIVPVVDKNGFMPYFAGISFGYKF